MTKILLTGKAGQLGYELTTYLAPLGEVIAVDRQQLDLSQPEQVRQVVRELQPQVIVNAAAYTAVDKAESEPELANTVNGTSPTVMAEEAQRLGAVLLSVSTDYVFDGQKNTPYLEEDMTNPIGVYGQSKLLGEAGIRSACDRHLILRTAWVYGTYGKGNFVKTMLRLGAEREELRVVIDQVGSPTWTGDLAQAIAQFVPKLLQGQAVPGTYHFTNSGAISWYDFAVAIFAEARTLGFPLKIQRVIPITTAEYPTPAKRPAYSVLSGQKTSNVLGSPAPHWQASLRKMLAEVYTANG